jgi:hypothetical protein
VAERLQKNISVIGEGQQVCLQVMDDVLCRVFTIIRFCVPEVLRKIVGHIEHPDFR